MHSRNSSSSLNNTTRQHAPLLATVKFDSTTKTTTQRMREKCLTRNDSTVHAHKRKRRQRKRKNVECYAEADGERGIVVVGYEGVDE